MIHETRNFTKKEILSACLTCVFFLLPSSCFCSAGTCQFSVPFLQSDRSWCDGVSLAAGAIWRSFSLFLCIIHLHFQMVPFSSKYIFSPSPPPPTHILCGTDLLPKSSLFSVRNFTHTFPRKHNSAKLYFFWLKNAKCTEVVLFSINHLLVSADIFTQIYGLI